jgi:hypothetical protein
MGLLWRTTRFLRQYQYSENITAMNYALAYSKMSDHELQELSRQQKNLVEEAVLALKTELGVRGVSFLSEADPSANAYEAFDGIVVANNRIVIPTCCPRCLSQQADIPLTIQSADSKLQYRVIYSKLVWQTYEFFFCRACANELKGSGTKDPGVGFQNLTGTKHQLFFFAHAEYRQLFLQVNL